MRDRDTKKGPARIPDVGYRFRLGAKLEATSRDIDFAKTKNAQAGPRWDLAVRADDAAIAAKLQEYIDRRKTP